MRPGVDGGHVLMNPGRRGSGRATVTSARLGTSRMEQGRHGIIWAVPADAPLVVPGDCSKLDDTWLEPPRPPGAVRLMQAIESDGSPWSYLSASILCREAAEFGAVWHGCVWSDQTILSKPPRQAGGQDASDDALKLTGDAPVGNWTWHGAACGWRIATQPRNPLRLSSLVILGVVARMSRCATRSSYWFT